MNGRTGRARPEPPLRRRSVRRPSRWPWLVSLVAAAVVLGPGLGRGYLLLRDMVFVPSPALTGRLLGIGHETPRAVPSDLVVALASHVLPGDIVEKLLLAAILVAAGVGAARLAPRGPLPESAAALAAMWNPFVAERLTMGQWALLVGYAALPWVVRGAARAARGGSGGLPLALGLALGALGGAAAWLLVALGSVAAVVGVMVSRRERGPVLGRLRWWAAYGAALALPWAVPALLRPQPLGSDPAGFAVFAPRADTPLGVLASILTGGAAWNADAVPPGRDTVLGLVGALALLGWSMAGLWLTRRGPVLEAQEEGAAYRAPLVAVGVGGLAIASVSTLSSVLGPLAGLPGGGLLRDGSRELGLWVLVVAVGAGWGVAWLQRTSLPALAAALVALLPVAALPSLGWGLSGQLRPIDYPEDVLAAAAMVDAAPGPGAVVVLPFETVRRYPWNGGGPSLTPWPRLLDRRVAVASHLVVSTPTGLRTVAGEDAYAAAVRDALAGPDPVAALEALGVGWLISDSVGQDAPAGATSVLQGAHATVYHLSTTRARADAIAAAYDPPTGPVLAGDGVCLLAMVGGVVVAARRKERGLASGRRPTTIG